jgi:Tol biopolymer transport system component
MSRCAAFIVCVCSVLAGSMPTVALSANASRCCGKPLDKDDDESKAAGPRDLDSPGVRLEDNFVMFDSPVEGTLFYLAQYPGTVYSADLHSKTNTPLLEAAYDGLQGNFDISADGQKIVVAVLHQGGWDIAWGHIRKGQRTSVEIVSSANDRDEDPRWIPGSEKVVFKRNNGIAILDLGTHRVDEVSPYGGLEKWAPTVSSDGQWLAVTEGVVTPRSPSPSRLLLMNFLDGARITIATNQPLWFPAFKSNGDLLYVVHTRECDDQVYLMQWRGRTVPEGKHLTTSGSCSGSEADPSVAKGNDAYVLFVSQRTGRYGVYIHDQLTGRVTRLLANDTRDLLAPQLVTLETGE